MKTTLIYTRHGADRVRKADGKGWRCIWEFRGESLVPGYWQHYITLNDLPKKDSPIVFNKPSENMKLEFQINAKRRIRHAMSGKYWVSHSGAKIAKILKTP